MHDLEFVQRFVKGDRQIQDEFLTTYSRLIYNYIHSVLNTKGFKFSQDHINDIFQEIFCSLINDNYRKLKTFKAANGCSLASWLRQVTINFTIDYIRKIKPVVSIEEKKEDELSLEQTLVDGSASINEVLSNKEKLAQLKDCIDQLGNDDKYFLELNINQGISLDELTRILDISRGAVDMRKSRLLMRLKECFKSKGFLLDL
jgi:RNA polymerase sigma factor (sigma-70 family)